MDERVDDNKGTDTKSGVGRGSNETSLTLIPGPNTEELPTGKRACQALGRNEFWARASQRLLTDGMLKDSWAGMHF